MTRPQAAAQPRAQKFSDHLAFFKLYMAQHKLKSIITILALFVAGFLEGIGIALLLPVVATLSGGTNPAAHPNIITQTLSGGFQALGIPFTLGWLLFVMVLFIVGKGIISILAMREVGHTAAQVTADFRFRLIRALLGARWKSYVDLALGRAASALGPEAERVAYYYMVTCTAIAEIFQALIYFMLALFMSWKLSIMAVIAGGLVMFSFRRIVRMTRRAGFQQTASLNDLLKRLSDALGSVKAIKAMAREDHYAGLLRHDVRLLEGAHRDSHFSKEILRFMREPIMAVLMAAGLYFAAYHSQTDFSSLMVLALVFLRMVMSFMAVQSSYQRMTEQESSFYSVSRLIEQLEGQKEILDGTETPSLNETLTFKDVRFSYENQQHAPVLRDFSASFPARKLNMIVGPSGAGKTTLLDLIIGFHQPESGDIFLDGTPLHTINKHEWRRALSYVPQDSGLFNDTVYNNIALGDETISEHAVWSALEKSGADEFVRALPKGLQDNVGERGQRLSGGQRQRIAIARALVRGPLLLLLDEPTSALDHKNETALMDVLKDLSKDLTVIMITHNTNLKPYADQVIEISPTS